MTQGSINDPCISNILTINFKEAMRCLQAKPYKYRCYSCQLQAAVTSELANRLFHVLGKDYFMLHKI